MGAMMQRKDNARSALIAFLDTQERLPTVFGESDCLLFLAGGVEAMTGEDYAADYRGKYTTLAEGVALIGMTPLAKVKSLFAEIHPSEARDGDIAAIKQGRDYTFGFFMGGNLFVRAETGSGILPRADVTKAFRVGDD
jgi:hypothetical protein